MARNLAKEVNTKPKAFFNLVKSSFEDDTEAKVGAKVLLYSRSVEMDKIAECLGGKDDLHKRVMD